MGKYRFANISPGLFQWPSSFAMNDLPKNLKSSRRVFRMLNTGKLPRIVGPWRLGISFLWRVRYRNGEPQWKWKAKCMRLSPHRPNLSEFFPPGFPSRRMYIIMNMCAILKVQVYKKLSLYFRRLCSDILLNTPIMYVTSVTSEMPSTPGTSEITTFRILQTPSSCSEKQSNLFRRAIMIVHLA